MYIELYAVVTRVIIVDVVIVAAEVAVTDYSFKNIKIYASIHRSCHLYYYDDYYY